jgi:outer membrane receptor protein involved in Fe transport
MTYAQGKSFIRSAALVLAAFALPFATAASAQTRDLAEVRGHIQDSQDKSVAGAQVTLTNEDTGISRDTQTDSGGNYSFLGVPLTGHYSIAVSASSFAPAERSDIELKADVAASIDFTLNIAAAQENVTVYGTAAGVETDSNQIEDRLDSQKIQDTPLLGNKLTGLVLLDSSVKPSQTTGDLFQDETLFVVDGGGRRNTTLSIDNTTADDSWGRQTLFTSLPITAVQEFTILTNASSAEYGRTSGSAVNIVTKSGTNDFHGDFLGMGRPGGSEAREKLAPGTSRAVNTMSEGDGAITGPIIKDRTHFLIAGEYNHQNRDAVITSPLDPSVYSGNYEQGLFIVRIDHQLTARNALSFRVNFDQFTDTNPQDGVANTSLSSTARVFTKNTYAAALSDTWTHSTDLLNEARIQWQVGSPITQFIPVTPGPQLSQSGIFTYGDSRFAMLQNHQYEEADTLTWIRGRHTLKGGFDLIESSSGGFGQEFGTGYLDGQFTLNTTSCFTLTATSPLPNDSQCNAPSAAPIPIANIGISQVTKYTQTFGNQAYNIRELLWATFLQDNWAVTPSLTLNLGVRYEGQTFTNDDNNVAPRLGFAWRVPHTTSTVVRGGYGIYNSEIRIDEAAGYLLGGPTGLFTFTANPGQCGFPTSITPWPSLQALLQSPGCSSGSGFQIPERTITVQLGAASSLSQYFNVSALHSFPNQLLNPYTQQWTLGIEHEIAKGWIVSLDYTGQHSVKLERPADLNAPSPCFYTTGPTVTTGTTCQLTEPTATTAGGVRSATVANATRPVQPAATCTTTSASFIASIGNCFNNYSAIMAIINAGSASYEGAQVKLTKQFSHHFTLLASYTYSHSINTVEPDAANQNPNDFNFLGAPQEKASSVLDQRNRASLSGWYSFPLGFRFGAVATLSSGFPYNVITGVDNNGDSVVADRPFLIGAVVPRNFAQGTPLYDVDTSLAKYFAITERFHIDLRADVFNLFNHANYYARNGTYGNTLTAVSTFGAPMGGLANVGPSRMMQFSARFGF